MQTFLSCICPIRSSRLNFNASRADVVSGSYSAPRPLIDDGYHRGNNSYKMVNRRRDVRQEPYARTGEIKWPVFDPSCNSKCCLERNSLFEK